MFQRFVSIENGRETLTNLHVNRVAFLMMGGWRLAMMDEDYDIALARLSFFFDHSDRNQADALDAAIMEANRGETLLHQRKDAEAVVWFRRALAAEKPGDRRIMIHWVRGVIGMFYADKCGPDDVAPSEIIDLLNDMLRQFRKSQRPRRMLRPNATARQVSEFTNAAFQQRMAALFPGEAVEQSAIG